MLPSQSMAMPAGPSGGGRAAAGPGIRPSSSGSEINCSAPSARTSRPSQRKSGQQPTRFTYRKLMSFGLMTSVLDPHPLHAPVVDNQRRGQHLGDLRRQRNTALLHQNRWDQEQQVEVVHAG